MAGVRTPDGPARAPLTARRIAASWWPLAASWLLMGVELPMLSAVVARMADPEINLAAYGSVVFPVALVIEAPIIMLLAASTALSVDWASYRKLRRFMLWAGASLTALHVLVAFTPLYYLVARGLIGAPEEVIEPARIGLRIMTPWTWAIAYRRFQQGVLIRFEHSRAVWLGTLVRLAGNALVLALGWAIGGLPGIVVGTAAVATGVTSEAAFIGWSVQPVLRERLRPAPAADEPLTRSAFLRFYVPLAMTPLLTLLIQPAGAAAMSRMPGELSSLAAWPAVHGLVFLFRSTGFAFNEVVVSRLGDRGGQPALARFTAGLALVMVALLVLISLTPLSSLWYGGVSGFSDELSSVAVTATALAVLMPGYQVLQSYYGGALVQARRTRGITEAVAIYVVVAAAALGAGVAWQRFTGIHFAVVAFTLGGLLQTVWLWWRSRSALAAPGPPQ
jgi:hypothetical protein